MTSPSSDDRRAHDVNHCLLFLLVLEFDRNGDGLISVSELRHTLNAMNQSANEKISEFEAMQLVSEADHDGDRMINYSGR